MWKMRSLFYLMLALLPILSLAQEPECNALGFNRLPRAGSDLPQCATPDLQCCSQDTIVEYEGVVLRALRDGLVDEFGFVVDEYLKELEHVIAFFGQVFSERLIDRFPGGKYINKTNSEITEIKRYLSDNLIIPERMERDQDRDDGNKKRQMTNDFKPEEFVERLFEAGIDGDAEALGQGDQGKRECVERFLNSAVDRKKKELFPVLANETQRIRQALTTLNRIGQFLRERRVALDNATILNQCVSTFVNISFCSRCTNRTAPLCFNGCNALLRACYAPYLEVLNRQYSDLWTLVQRVITTANFSVGKLYRSFETFMDDGDGGAPGSDATDPENSFEMRIGKECELDIPDDLRERPPRKRQTRDQDEDEDEREENSREEKMFEESDGIPRSLVGDILTRREVIRYKSEGLRFCLRKLNQDEACSSPAAQTMQYCERTEICTARCQCTIGNGRQEDDIEEFMRDDIQGQVGNPILSLSQDELNGLAASLESEDPVASFLTSDEITSVIPPDPEENEGGGGGEEPSGAGHSVVSLALVLSTLLLGLFAISS